MRRIFDLILPNNLCYSQRLNNLFVNNIEMEHEQIATAVSDEDSYEYESSSPEEEVTETQEIPQQEPYEQEEPEPEASPQDEAPDLTSNTNEDVDHEPRYASEGDADELSDVSDDESLPPEEPPEPTFPFNYVQYFTEHPAKANQTYFTHLTHALKFSIVSGMCSFMFLIHGLFPFLFEFTGSDHLLSLALEIEQKRKLVQENMLKKLKQQKELKEKASRKTKDD